MTVFRRDLHIRYIQSLEQNNSELKYLLTSHLRINGLYWGILCLHLLNKKPSKEEIIPRILKCLNDDGGFGADKDHDSHILFTLSAIQILVLYNALDEINTPKTRDFVLSLLQENGSFSGDKWGEVDTRFKMALR